MSTQTVVDALVAASGNPAAALFLKATLAMVVSLLLIRAARGASASVRHLVAAAGFGVLLLLPMAAAVVPERSIAVLPAVVTEARTVEATAPAPAVAARVRPAPATPAAPAATFGLAKVGLVLYGTGVAGFGIALLAGVARLRRVSRNAEVSVAGTRLANEAARREGMPGGIQVAVSSELAVPITFGWSRPVILLPAEAAGWETSDRARAIRHELEHIRRGDWAVHVLARAALALYWPHPLAWSLWRALRLEAERACDDAVIRSQGQAEPYAEQLVTLARRLRGRGAVPALSMATRSTLGQRVDAILDDRLRRAPLSPATALAAAAAGLACVLALGPVRVVVAAPDEPEVAHVDDDDDDESPDMRLFEAAARGDLAGMRALMESGARADAILRGDGTPLIAAARRGRIDAMELLIENGADVNVGVGGDGNAITNAAREGQLEAVKLLLARGADIDLGVPGDGNALIMAAGAGRLDVVRYLVENGASIEKVVPGDENPLIHASEGGQAEVVRYLIAKGANVDARVWVDWSPGGKSRGEWRTPLSMARRNGHQDVVRILKDAGARE